MDKILISNWNSRVHPGDNCWILGDLCFCKGSQKDKMAIVQNYLHQLNGNLHFIRGNHDGATDLLAGHFASYQDVKMISVEGQRIFLSHYSHRVWPSSHHSAWHLYAHSHGTLPDDPYSLSIDVGVDCHNYAPISFEEVKAIMAKKKWRPIDHHGAAQEGGGVGLSRDEYLKAERYQKYLQLKDEFENEY